MAEKTADRNELREDLRKVLQKHLSDTKLTGVVASYFANCIVAFNNQRPPSSIPVPENVATANQRIAEGLV